MAWFGRKKDKVIDLGKRFKEQEKKLEAPSPVSNDNVASGLGFLGDIASSVSKSDDSGYIELSNNTEDRKNKLAKRLLDMTNKIEDLSNQIYHLKQRMEVLEKKMKVGFK